MAFLGCNLIRILWLRCVFQFYTHNKQIHYLLIPLTKIFYCCDVHLSTNFPFEEGGLEKIKAEDEEVGV